MIKEPWSLCYFKFDFCVSSLEFISLHGSSSNYWTVHIFLLLDHCDQLANSLCCAVVNYFSPVQPFVTLWTIGHHVPLSIEFYRQECWSGLSCSPTGDLPNPGIEPTFLMFPALAGVFFTTSATWDAPANSIALLFLRLF